MNLIGDIAGNFKTLMALLKQMPDEEPVGLGAKRTLTAAAIDIPAKNKRYINPTANPMQ